MIYPLAPRSLCRSSSHNLCGERSEHRSHIESSGVRNLNQIRLVRSLSKVTAGSFEYPRASLIQLESADRLLVKVRDTTNWRHQISVFRVTHQAIVRKIHISSDFA